MSFFEGGFLPAIFLNADFCESVDFREKESFLTSLRPAFMIILGCGLALVAWLVATDCDSGR